jgi:SAM-dependent methyltransferase
MSQARYYDRYWSDPAVTEGAAHANELDGPVRRLVEDVVAPGTTCLDVGCGDGRTAGSLVSGLGGRYVGVEISAPAVEKARSAGLDVRRIEDAATLPFDDESFEVVLCFEVLEHLFDACGAATEMQRVLQPGGILIATVPNVAYWKRRLEALVGRWNPLGDDDSVQRPWRDPHIRFFNPASLRRLLTEAGFESVQLGGHRSAGIRDVPYLGRWLPPGGSSRAYRRLERLWPGFFGFRLDVLARKPRTTTTR